MTSLNWRRLLNPAAIRTSCIGSVVVSISDRAKYAHRIVDKANGPAPSSEVTTRVRCRSE
ncbi:hypothetical protein Acsp05_15330 [Actinokineospora sp. NBRC 105648]|nr:hypothetical protein Acsp05_15330 [Actinokineospora sp. NBRC 105648]